MVEVKSVRHVALATFAVAAFLALALLVLVVPVYGDEFEPSIGLGLILLPGAALVGVAGVLMATIVGRGRPLYSLYLNLMTTPLTIALYAALIPAFGATGAALASSCSYAASFVGACVYYRKVTGRSAIGLLWPTRSELDDLRAVPRAVAARLARRGG
jgi:O-antigen/teichoic acid export membrane protein